MVNEVAEGVAQRVRALELFLADVYGAARIVSDGLIPHDVVTSSPGFVRAAYGFTPPNGVRIHVAGIDVIRDEDGEFRVLEDNLRSPSGVSYVLANRAAMARVLPELFWGQPIQMVTDYPARLINALRRAAPACARPIRRSWSSRRACTTRPSTSTRCWPGSWACTSSRDATWCATAPTSSCGRPRARCRST